MFSLLLTLNPVVVSRGLTRLRALRILLSIWQCYQLLLQLRGNVDWCKMGCVGSAIYLWVRPHENTCIWRAWRLDLILNLASLITNARIQGESSIDISTLLVELNCLPCVFCCVADTRAFKGLWVANCYEPSVWRLPNIMSLNLNVPFNLILSESEWKIQLKRAIYTSTLRLAHLIAIIPILNHIGLNRSLPTFCCPAGIWRSIIVGRTICGCCRSWREERCLGTRLVCSLIHFSLHVDRFPNWIS